MFRRLTVVAIATVAMLAVLLPGAALAKGRDGNHDGLPDRWERGHGLSLAVKQARRDQDDDGLRNLAEYRHHSDPRNADSDHDGVKDGAEVKVGQRPDDRDSDHDGVRDRDEHAGTVKVFDGTQLTITLAGGGTLTGDVLDGVTEIECRAVGAHSSSVAGDDDPAGDDHGSGGHGADDPAGDDHGSGGHGADDPAGDDRGHDDARCAAADIKVGAVVREAEVRAAGGRAVFKEIKLR